MPAQILRHRKQEDTKINRAHVRNVQDFQPYVNSPPMQEMHRKEISRKVVNHFKQHNQPLLKLLELFACTLMLPPTFYNPKFTEFSKFYEKLPCMQACIM